MLCSAVEAAKEPGAKLEVWPSLTHDLAAIGYFTVGLYLLYVQYDRGVATDLGSSLLQHFTDQGSTLLCSY